MQLHRYYIRALVRILLVLCTFASCINDDFSDDSFGIGYSEGSTPYYLSLQLNFDTSVSSTRSIESGSHEEHEIGETGNYAILFDGGGNLFGIYPLVERLVSEHEDYEEDIKEGTYLRLLHVYPRNNKLPESCLVVLNANGDISSKIESYKDKIFSKTADEIMKEIWSVDEHTDPKTIGFADSDHEYFTMTNSIYMDGTNKKDVVSIKNKIYPTIKEALNNRTIVYVERMVAKFSFKEEENKDYYQIKVSNPASTSDEQVWLYNGYYNDEGDKDPEDSDDPGNLRTKNITELCRIKITGWGINALETESHFFKNIKSTNYFANWSSSDRYRSHWSEDPHYGDNYPWQYRYAVDKRNIGYYFDEKTKMAISPLRNYSYNQFVTESAGDGYSRDVYTPENTYGEDVLDVDYDNRTNLLAGTHLIVCAQLYVDKTVRDAEIGSDNIWLSGDFVPITFYRDRIGVYYKNPVDCLAELIKQFNHELKSQSTMRFKYYDWSGSTTSDPNDGITFTAKSTGDYQLYYNNERLTPSRVRQLFGSSILSKAHIKDGDGKLLPWVETWAENFSIKNSDGATLKIYNAEYDLYQDNINISNGKPAVESIRDANINDIKSMLFEWVGAIDHFNEGQMYYAEPVLHNAASNPDHADMTNLGDYGVVRNHWYKFTLQDIMRIGTPVDNPDEEIVPNRVKTNDQLNFKVEIPKWHEIETTVPVL